MPLEEIMIEGITAALILFDSSGVEANVNPGQCSGEPYFRIMSRVSSLYSSSCFRKISTALIAIGLSQNTGSRGICPDSINCLTMKTNFCVRSTANAGTITLPPRCAVDESACQFGHGIFFRMRAVAVSRLHHHDIRGLAFFGPECTTLPGATL